MKRPGSEPRARRRGRGLLCGLLVLAIGLGALGYGARRYFRARYPMRYADILVSSAEEFGLPPSLLFAVAHTESAFDPRAVSNVDARGLMQIRRDTWDWVEHKMRPDRALDYDDYSFDPQASARYGAFLIRILYDEFGSYELALCAYHAGRGNVRKWLADPALSPDGVTVPEIPFRDTNWYVERVGRTRAAYQKLYALE